jgi:hypothetical protein
MWISSPGNLDPVRYVAEALFEPDSVAGVYPEHPRVARLLACTVSMLNGKLRLAALLLACSADQAGFYVPYTAKAYERSPRAWPSAYLLNLVEFRPSLDEVVVAGEGYEDRWERWSL